MESSVVVIEVWNGFSLSSQNINESSSVAIDGVGGWFVITSGSLKIHVETSRTTVLYATPSREFAVVSKILSPKRTGNSEGNKSPSSASSSELIWKTDSNPSPALKVPITSSGFVEPIPRKGLKDCQSTLVKSAPLLDGSTPSKEPTWICEPSGRASPNPFRTLAKEPPPIVIEAVKAILLRKIKIADVITIVFKSQ